MRLWRKRSHHTEVPGNPTLLHLSSQPEDGFRLYDSFEGVQVFGSSGSGKTSGSGAALARAYLSAGFGGLVLTNKVSDKADWLNYLRQTGREDDLLILSPESDLRLNFLEYERSRPGRGAGLTENLVNLFTVLMEASEKGSGRSSDRFFDRAVKRLLRNTFDLMMMADEPLSMRGISELVASAPSDVKLLIDNGWLKKSFCYQLIERARHCKHPDFPVVVHYWLGQFPDEDPRTQSNVLQTFFVMADMFNRGVLHQLFGTDLNITPDITQEGKILLIDLPIKEFSQVGRLAAVLAKYLWQQATERRDVTASPRPQFLWCDEAQELLVSTDSQFQATARSSRTATVYLTQSISAYYAQLGAASEGKATVDAFLANLGTKIFHCNGDAETNDWAERLIAKDWQYRANASVSSPNQSSDDKGKPQNNDPTVSSGVNPSLDANVLASQFTKLRRGGPACANLVDALVFQAGRVWLTTGKNYLPVTFSQA
ncbi:MAG: hypothetical protein AAGC72_00435 [Planctomycetota bacterium]